MTQTVIGLFDNEKEAQQAVQQLFNDGFTDSNVDINTRVEDRVGYSDHKESNKENGFFKFFNNLFGTDNEADKYTKVAERCSAMVTVHADTSDEAERAADIMDLYGAVDIDKKASEFGYNYNYNVSQRQNSDSAYGENRVNQDFDDTGIVNSARERFNSESDNEFIPNHLEGETNRRPFAENENRNLDDDLEYNRSETNRDYVDSDQRSFPIVEEDLNIEKREVETGGIRVRSRIVERPVEENLRLRQERVRVERNPVNREATDTDFRSFEEGEIELTERGEVSNVSKEARVVEEVRLRKEVEDVSETVRDSVRRTEVDVENFRSDDELRGRDKI